MDLAKQEQLLQQIQENKGIILKICHSYCTKQQDREDVAQEIMYQLWKSAPHFDHKVKFSTWMYRVALNVAISFYRKHELNQPIILSSESIVNVAEQDETHNSETAEKSRLLQQFIHELKALDRALMILYLESRPYAEIADIIGISTTNVATKINRIKQQLKHKFSQYNK